VVRISRTPGDRIVTSSSFREPKADDLIQTVGCFCITFLRGQSRTLQQTPRWERWGRDIQGYRAYRRGLEHQNRAELTLGPSDHQPADRRELSDYKLALESFHEAARFEPADRKQPPHGGQQPATPRGATAGVGPGLGNTVSAGDTSGGDE
jgi:hypothetical protein